MSASFEHRHASELCVKPVPYPRTQMQLASVEHSAGQTSVQTEAKLAPFLLYCISLVIISMMLRFELPIISCLMCRVVSFLNVDIPRAINAATYVTRPVAANAIE